MPAIIFDLRRRQLNPSVPRRAISALKGLFSAGYGAMPRNQLVFLNAAAGSDASCQMAERISLRARPLNGRRQVVEAG